MVRGMATTVRFLHYTTFEGVSYRPNDEALLDDGDAYALVYAYRATWVDGPPAPVGPPDPYPQYARDADFEDDESGVMLALRSLFPLRSELASVALLGSWGAIAGKPDFSPVAFTGSYNDLIDTPAGGGGTSAVIDPGNPTVLIVNLSESVYIDPTKPSVLVFSTAA